MITVNWLNSNETRGVSSITFSGGEVHPNFKIQVPKGKEDAVQTFTIKAQILNSDDLMELFLVTDAIRNQVRYDKIDLELLYLPYARQDRVCAPGDAFSLRVLANLINSQNYASVTCLDPHNAEVTSKLFHNLRVITANTMAIHLASRCQYDWIVSPDAGAFERVSRFIVSYNMLSPASYHTVAPRQALLLVGSKSRNPETGELSNTRITIGHSGIEPETLAGSKCLIVDDIADGGRTFSNLAAILREKGAERIDLFVSHGIFSHGTKGLGLDNVYTTDSLPEKDDGRLVVKRFFY